MEGIDPVLSESLKQKIATHRQRFISIFKGRYLELLPSLINYKNDTQTSVDFMKVEVALRNGYDVVVGETIKNNIQVIGYTKGLKTSNNPMILFNDRLLNEKDIQFVIPKHLRKTFYKEISYYDSCQTGNFIVLKNKTLNYTNDYEILDHYIQELSEIVISRYSISMQVKVTTLFLGEVGDESINQLISSIYNGDPYIKGSKLFDPVDQIFHMNNENIAQNFQELKREYQNKISELNNMLGMNSLAVEKSSGVSDEEAKSNRSFTTSNANIYLDGRNNGLKKLNKRFNLQIEALYNDEALSEIAEITNENDAKDEGAEKNDSNSKPV